MRKKQYLRPFKQVLQEYPQARLLIAPREIYRGHDVQNLAKRYELNAQKFVVVI